MSAVATPLRAQLADALAALRALNVEPPGVLVILGTGLARLADDIEERARVAYDDIPHFPISTVESHHGVLRFGRLGGHAVVAMQGRFHRYEGYTLQQVTFPVRVARLLGAHTMVVANASGGMNPLWQPGDLMLLDDHINLLGDNPLVGPNHDDLGPRFPDMSEPYDRTLQRLAEECALELGFALRRGVYAAVPGPNLETRAEYRMLRTLGADSVGMSTVPEVIVARHMGMRVLGLSIITDQCLPDALEPTSLEAILAVAGRAEPKLAALVRGVLERLPQSSGQER